MHLSKLLTTLLAAEFSLVSAFSLTPRDEPVRNSTGLTDVVSWDNYTLWLQDQRIFLHSGEFHAFRLPVPDLWLDIFQKVKAAGLNAVSIYTHWALTNPAPGILDFDGYRDLQPLFDAAKAAGLWIVLRPGPYINAETTAGGFALWATSQVAGGLRSNATDYTEAWTPYIQAIAALVAENQITKGGPIIAVQIDNEYSQDPVTGAYFALLESAYRNASVVVPLTYNDPGEGKNFVNGTGSVDIYGLDAYPQSFDCSNPTVWKNVTDNYHSYHEDVNGWQPFYMPEFQGGSFDPWAGPGYNACAVLTGADFEQVFYQHNWASNAKMVSYYMIYGGSSWGGIPFPGVYSSYDYGSSIAENRALTSKYDELKRQGLFLRSVHDFYKTDWIGNSSAGVVTLSNADAFATHLQNPDTGSNFYITRHADSTSTTSVNFTLQVSTSNGTLTLPQKSDSLVLNGRQSKIVATDYSWGSSKTLYSTASILFAGTVGARDVLFLYGDGDQSTEIALILNTREGTQTSDSRVTFTSDANYTSIAFAPGDAGVITVYESDTELVLYSDPVTAATFWAPVIPAAAADFSSYWQIGSNETVLVGGPYLIRNATVSSSTLALVGDLNATVSLTVLAPSGITNVTWNGADVGVSQAVNSSFLVGQLTYSSNASSISLPTLGGWKFADSLPEIQANFSDADWVVADHNTTNLPAPWYGDGRVLYGCDYGFCENTIIWRGHFNATGSETSANLSINGGGSFAASVWINDQFVNTTFPGAGVPETDRVYTFPNNSVIGGQDNVITIVQDHMGNDEGSTAKSPRGVRGFQLNDGNFTSWKVQGKKGGYTNFTDRARGVLNEGGSYGERQGWHLPGFDTSSWENRSLSDGIPYNVPGLGFFVTTFDLAIPAGFDVPISFVFDQGSSSQSYRAVLFVNGWHMGKRVANLGPQAKFPVHQGILDYSGTNTVALLIWATESEAISPSLDLVIDGVYEGGVGPIATNNPGQLS